MSEGTRKMRGRPVTHEEARKSALRLINSHFGNPNPARASIPVEASDDDVTVMDYIAEQEAAQEDHLRSMNTGMTDFRGVADENERALLIQELRGPDHPLR